MSSKDKLRQDITAAIKSRLNAITGGSWDTYYYPNIPEKITRCATFDFMCWEDDDDILAVVDTTLSHVCDEGLVFTTEALHYKNGNDSPEAFEYDEIESMRVIPHWYGDDLEIDTGYERTIGATYYKKKLLMSLLADICAIVRDTSDDYEEDDDDDVDLWGDSDDDDNDVDLWSDDEDSSGSDIAGTVYGSVSAASTAYGYDKFATPQGHGFAAEKANHMWDKLRGLKAKILGDDNAPNGADRSVDGVLIQSKYCMSGQKCINECFTRWGRFRYYAPDGSPMQIEVPADMYDEAVAAMQDKIRHGKIKGVTDPAKAKDIVRQGHYTYQQAKNIARAGNIDSIKFDAQNGMITGAYAGGISAAISFAVSVWNGEDFDEAVINAGMSFLKVGGTAAVTSLCASQLARTSLNSALVGTTDAIVAVMGPKASALLVNAFRSGTNIYGAAAMKSASKLLRGNFITAAISTAILSSFDIANLFMGRISGKQLFKNFMTTAAGVGGGVAGWAGGAATGAAIGSFIPIIGTTVGGVVGGILGAFGGGSVAGEVTKSVLDEFVEDDADEMVRIIQSEFEDLAGEYLIGQNEARRIVDRLQDKIDGSTIKDMYASSSRYGFAEDLLRPLFDEEVSKREHISLPNNAALLGGIRRVLENMEAA